MYVILIPVQIKPGFRERFIELLGGNALAAPREEPGCIRFDVIQDASDRDRVWFYEVYTDEEAFKAHQRSPHFLAWRPYMREMAETGTGAGVGTHNIYPPDEEFG